MKMSNKHHWKAVLERVILINQARMLSVEANWDPFPIHRTIQRTSKMQLIIQHTGIELIILPHFLHQTQKLEEQTKQCWPPQFKDNDRRVQK